MEINGNQWKSMERNQNQDSAEECWGQNLTEKHRLGPYFTFCGPGKWFGTCFGTFRNFFFSTSDQNFDQNSPEVRPIGWADLGSSDRSARPKSARPKSAWAKPARAKSARTKSARSGLEPGPDLPTRKSRNWIG